MQNVRQLLLYLKSLRVRPAARRALASLEGGFRHRRWAGLTKYTKPFGIALGYVFGKQSGDPCDCNLHSPLFSQRQE